MAYNSLQYKINVLQSQYIQKQQQIDSLQVQIDNNNNAVALIGTPGFTDTDLTAYATTLNNATAKLVTEQKQAFVMLKSIYKNLNALGVSNVG